MRLTNIEQRLAVVTRKARSKSGAPRKAKHVRPFNPSQPKHHHINRHEH